MRVLAGVPVPLSAVAKCLESNGRKHQGQSSLRGTALDVFVQFLSRCQEGGFVPVWKRLS